MVDRKKTIKSIKDIFKRCKIPKEEYCIILRRISNISSINIDPVDLLTVINDTKKMEIKNIFIESNNIDNIRKELKKIDNINKAKGIIANISSNKKFDLDDISLISESICSLAKKDADIAWDFRYYGDLIKFTNIKLICVY